MKWGGAYRVIGRGPGKPSGVVTVAVYDWGWNLLGTKRYQVWGDTRDPRTAAARAELNTVAANSLIAEGKIPIQQLKDFHIAMCYGDVPDDALRDPAAVAKIKAAMLDKTVPYNVTVEPGAEGRLN